VGIVGVGNAAATLLQGLSYYGEDDSRPGLWHRVVGGYRVANIDVAAAFDVDRRKIGLDIAEAAFKEPNVAEKAVELKPLGVEVQMGVLSDKPVLSLEGHVEAGSQSSSQLAETLSDRSADVLLNLISSGMQATSRAYAQASLEAGCCLLNATPARIATDPALVGEFHARGLSLAGDDLMSQFGGTVFHRGLLAFMHGRGVRVLRSYQLDVGGGAETLNTLEEEVKAVKRDVKTTAISSELPYRIDTTTGTTDYVDFMGNRRTSYFWVEAEGFLGSPIRLDVYLRTSDGPNAGNALLDVVRALKAARENGRYGVVDEVCAAYFKSPPVRMRVNEAQARFSAEYLSAS